MNSNPSTPNNDAIQDFEGGDLRGKSFPGPRRYANFRHIITGPPPVLHYFHQAFALLLAFFAGFTTAYAVATFTFLFEESNPRFWQLGLIIGFIIVTFWIFTLWKGLTYILGIISIIVIFLIVITVAIADKDIAGRTALNTLSISGSIAGIVGLAEALVLTQAFLRHLAFSILGLVIGAEVGLTMESTQAERVGLFLISALILGLGCYMGRRALQPNPDPRYKILQTLAINISTWHSTCFRDADLTAADFSNTTLRHTDFSNATLTRTCWRDAKFHQNNLQGTYLANPKIRRLVTTLDGQGQTFDRLDLRGVNLNEANLSGASFIGADLSNATLQGANLTNAKLAQTQLYGADLTGAILTGAYIENWGISPETHLDAIQCDYIYLRLPTDDNPDPYRKPDNRDETFQANDFTDFIAPILNTLKAYRQQTRQPTPDAATAKTLDLYHREGIDPTAAAIALQQLIDQHSEAQIQILSIKGVDQKIRIQASIAASVDPSPLNTDYFQRYNRLATQPNSNLQTLFETLAAQHTQLRSLEARIAAATDSPGSYVTIPPTSNTPPRRTALQRKRDRLHTAIDQQNQHLDILEAELNAVHGQRNLEMNDANRLKLRRQIEQLEENFEIEQAKLARLEQQLSELPL
ncbi:MAG: pentapeptide repeat-containing protein [Leptolyngbyaceae cyanobacterium MO_188.B28]|nr:pentapeptide repeat-containing protein [Leptolyngbyaceae cyanobacterium MO_188.B28]